MLVAVRLTAPSPVVRMLVTLASVMSPAPPAVMLRSSVSPAEVLITAVTAIVASFETVREPLPAKVIAPRVRVPADSLSYSMLPEPPAVSVSETASPSVEE